MCTEPNRSVSLRGVLTAAGVLAGVYVVWRVVAAAVPFLVLLSQAVLAACAAGTWLLFRLFRYGSVAEVFRRHRRVRVRRVALPRGARQAALPAGTQLMLEAAKPRVDAVITDVRERTGHAR